jgi:hypothetical protein
MTIVLGHAPLPHGNAALDAAIERATSTGEQVIVVNTTRGDAHADPRYARAQDVSLVVLLPQPGNGPATSWSTSSAHSGARIPGGRPHR